MKILMLVLCILLSACQSTKPANSSQVTKLAVNVYENTEIDKPARTIVKVSAKYPPTVSIRTDVKLMVSVVVNPKGEVVRAEIVSHNEKYKVFNREALAAIYKWRYLPAMHLKEKVYVRLTETFIWTDEGSFFL